MTAPMPLSDLYMVLMTNRLEETLAFYKTWFGFEPLFSSSWFHYMQSAGERPFGLALMDENHPSHPPVLPAFSSQSGVFLTLQVEDAQSEFTRLKEAGCPIVHGLKDEAWGQRRFSVLDPNGLFIDVVQQIEPQEGFWDAYM
jgi:uncharacterized glyoxalase superfamily protein PhnB